VEEGVRGQLAMIRVVGYLLMVLGLAFVVVGLFDLAYAVWLKALGTGPHPASPAPPSGLTAFIVAVAGLLRTITHLPAWFVSTGVGLVLIYFGWWLVQQADLRSQGEARRRRVR
jgi:hypothetical protein